MPVSVRPPGEDPKLFWDKHFRDPEAGKDDLLLHLASLRSSGQFTDVYWALRWFLGHHGKEAEPWMYEMMAVALVMNKGRESDVNTALGYAADLAVRRRVPHELTRIADTLAMHDLHERAGRLLDLAAEIDPGNATAPIMSMTLAERTRDPERMADAVERLLALGWPGTDQEWRLETRRRVEALAKLLEEEGRGDDARALRDRLARSEARDLFVRLSWAGDADLSLVVEEPLGATARVASPRTVFGGAIVTNGFGPQPEELYTCPRGFDGEYTIRVEPIQENPDDPARDVVLEVVVHEGSEGEQAQTFPIALPNPEPVVIRLEGGRRRRVLPYQAPNSPEGAGLVVSDPNAKGPSLTDEAAAREPTLSPADAADALRLPGGAGSNSPR